jgi:hypothetical protein
MLDENTPAAADGGDASHGFCRMDLRSPATARRRAESDAPLMLRAIAAAKKKNNRIDATEICDCLRRDFAHLAVSQNRSFDPATSNRKHGYAVKQPPETVAPHSIGKKESMRPVGPSLAVIPSRTQYRN